MRAFVLNRYGGPEGMGFREMPFPKPRADELLVRVHCAGLNPVDYKFRQRKLWPIYHPKLPVIMGNELAGTVTQLGAGVNRFAIGDRIFVRGHKAELGAFAEYACVPAVLAAKVPSSIEFAHAGGVPLAGLTALQVLRDEMRVRPGMQILITGGAGGVGMFAIQLAKQMGAVVAVTASPAGRSLVQSFGADRVIDYTHEDFTQIVRGLDGVFDLVGGDTLSRAFQVVKPGGAIVSIAGTPEPLTARKDLESGWKLKALFWLLSWGLRRIAKQRSVSYRFYFMHGSGSDLEQLAQFIDENKLRIVVDRVFPFVQIKEAFAYLEEGHAKGKVIVAME